MPPSELSKNHSFYQLASHATDNFTSCIRIYEALLPHFEAERPDDSVNRRLLHIDGVLTILYSELTTLKNEIETLAAVGNTDQISKPSVESKCLTQVVSEYSQREGTSFEASTTLKDEIATHSLVGDDKASKCIVGNKGLPQVVSEYSQQENIISVASTVEQNISNKDKVLKKLPERSWEDVRQGQGEEYQREKVNHEESVIEQTISPLEKIYLNPNEELNKQKNDFQYICENCNETVIVFNQGPDFPVALHNHGECCRGKPSKIVAVQEERQEKIHNTVFSEGQVQTKYQEASNRPVLIPTQPDKVKNVGDPRFSHIQSVAKDFVCTVCHEKLTDATNFVEHMTRSHHQTLLKESGKEIQKNTSYGANVTYAQLVKSFENKSPNSVEQKESIMSLNDELAKIINQRKYLSVREGVIVCALCGCRVPPNVTNVRDHVLGKKHSKKQTEMQPLN